MGFATYIAVGTVICFVLLLSLFILLERHGERIFRWLRFIK